MSSLSQENLSYLCMSLSSCYHQSSVAILTREGGDESGMEVTTWHYSSSMATAVCSELIHVYMYNMQPTMVPSWPHRAQCINLLEVEENQLSDNL